MPFLPRLFCLVLSTAIDFGPYHVGGTKVGGALLNFFAAADADCALLRQLSGPAGCLCGFWVAQVMFRVQLVLAAPYSFMCC